MTVFFKYIGILLIIISFSLYGFLKTHLKRSYILKLTEIRNAVKKADNMIRMGTYSKHEILKEIFGSIEGFNVLKDGVCISDIAISRELSSNLYRFFNEFGNGDLILERQRIKNIDGYLLSLLEKEQKQYTESRKIWQTAGICAGLILSIMLG